VKVFRPRHLNAAEAAASQASALQNQVEQLAQPGELEQHRHQLSRVHRRSSKSVVGSQGDDQVRSQLPVRVENRFPRRNGSEDLNVNDSARRRPQAQVNMSSAAEARRRDFVNRWRHRRVADLQVKHAAKERECKAPMVSRPRYNSNNNRSSGSAAARLREPSTDRGRVKVSRKVGRKGRQKKRHRQGRDNFIAITSAAPEREAPEPLLF
jgi:hypothetical protein